LTDKALHKNRADEDTLQQSACWHQTPLPEIAGFSDQAN
jgi:hypothetical protein